MTLDADKRDALRLAKARIAEIMAPNREAARKARKAHRKATKEARGSAPMKGQREPRLEDGPYLTWIRGLKCIACVQDQTPSRSMRSEAAHVRFADAKSGWSHTGKGEKPHDRRTLPLCHGHHREGPKAQHARGERAWWEARRISPPDLCAALSAAYDAGQDGAEVVRQFVRDADRQPDHRKSDRRAAAADDRTQILRPNHDH